MKTKIIPAILTILLFTGFMATAQNKPEVFIRFNNAQYDCPTQNYCVDVELKSDTPDQQLFGLNLRFYYDDNILEYLGASEFVTGYGMPDAPVIMTGPGTVFGLAGQADWVNGLVELLSPSPMELTSEWQKHFKICFHVDDPNSLNIANFCPSIIWDLQENAPEIGGGFQPGDDGVVMTVISMTGPPTIATTENVVQFNWEYGGNPGGFGQPVDLVCINTTCGYIIPVSNWALFLGIGLMIVATLFIYRRRMS